MIPPTGRILRRPVCTGKRRKVQRPLCADDACEYPARMKLPDLAQLFVDKLRIQRDPDRLDQADREVMDAFCGPVFEAARAWYDLTIDGVEQVPTGAALVVGNHDSGMSYFEAIGWGAAMHIARPDERWFGLAHDGIVDMPGVGNALISVGAIRARADLAAQALAEGHKVVVFPGGNAEAFRRFTDRYHVDLAGRTGWAKTAIRAGVPVVPVVFCGGHAGFVVLSEGRRLAKITGLKKALRVDTWPLWVGLPWGVFWGPFFHLPLPIPVRVKMLPPVPTAHLGAAAADDPHTVQAFAAQVVAQMQAAMDQMAAEHTTPWTVRTEAAKSRLARLARRVRASAG